MAGLLEEQPVFLTTEHFSNLAYTFGKRKEHIIKIIQGQNFNFHVEMSTSLLCVLPCGVCLFSQLLVILP